MREALIGGDLARGAFLLGERPGGRFYSVAEKILPRACAVPPSCPDCYTSDSVTPLAKMRRFSPWALLLAAGWASGCAPQVVDSKTAPTGDRASAETTSSAPPDRRASPPESQEVELRFPRESTPWLGVELRATEVGQAGVGITRVLPGSPAERAGLRPGDTLVQLGETAVTTPVEVSDWVAAQGSGTEHPISVLRESEQRLLRVVLEGRPEFEDRLRLSFVGRPAPEISGVATFQGEASSLKELRGRVVVLEFWASFCGVCRYLAPRLDAWHRTYKPQGAEVVGITVDPPSLGQEVAQRTGMSYTLASDPDGKVTNTYLASQIPIVIIIDRKGIVKDAMVGYSERRLRETESLIERLVAQDS